MRLIKNSLFVFFSFYLALLPTSLLLENAQFTKTRLTSPVSAAEPTPTTVKYLYDGDGNRVAVVNGTKITLYNGDFEKDLSTNETTKYYGIAGKRAAIKSNNSIRYVIVDQLDSVRVVVSETGEKRGESSYFPYGKVRNQVGVMPTKQFTGQVNDVDTGLMFYVTRYYNPDTGRFMTADMTEAPNRYAYVGNNPIMRNDPSGQEAVAGAIGLIGGFIGGTIVDATIQAISNHGKINWSRAAANGASIGVYAGCVGLTSGLGVTACGAASSAVSVVINTKLNMDEAGMDLGTAATSAIVEEGVGIVLGGALGKAVKTGGGAISTAAFKAYERFGNQELKGAVRALRGGDAQAAFEMAEQVYREVDPNFQGFTITNLDKGFGGSGTYLKSDLSSSRQASLAIHEASHGIDYMLSRSHSFAGKNVTMKNFGLAVENNWATEAKSYLTEVAAGDRSLSSALKQWNFSTSNQSGTIFEGFRDLVFAR